MGFLKDVATAFKPSNIAKGLDAARNPPSQAEIEASLQHLTPEQRAAYDANMQRVDEGRAASAQAMREALELEDRSRVLYGPAGRYLYGASMRESGPSSPEELEAQIAQDGVLGVVGAMRAERKGEFKDGVRQALNRDLVKQVDDPAERDRIARAERAARDEARAPYRAADASPMTISRLATRGETQLAEVLAWLGESGLSPADVFGVYRVPDRISGPLTPHSERGRVVEWDVVHTPGASGFDGGVVATSFVAAEHWVARRIGAPSVLDEDLALAFCREARVGPEQCFGLARISEFRSVHGGAEDHSPIRTVVKGVVALHPPTDGAAYARMEAAAPLTLDGTAAGVHIEVLNWSDLGRAVHPKIHEPAPVPSPFAYLPATPQELLRAYVEVVGLRPADCYAAQATVDRPRELLQGGLFTKNWGAKQLCADGERRVRTTGCSQIVVVYRDAPEYAAGRERWAAYQRDVLQARLEAGVHLRPPLVDDDDVAWLPTRPLRAAVRMADKIDWLLEFGTERLPPYRYCWPPVHE